VAQVQQVATQMSEQMEAIQYLAQSHQLVVVGVLAPDQAQEILQQVQEMLAVQVVVLVLVLRFQTLVVLVQQTKVLQVAQTMGLTTLLQAVVVVQVP
jgi:hypothetical protein